MKTTFLGIGSNIGRREENVLACIELLERCGEVTAVSSLYETTPVDCPPQRRFINLVVEMVTELSPCELLTHAKLIERRMGRKGAHNEPRKIDIDIIAMEDIVLSSEELTIPHALYHERAFVLVPLMEIAPSFSCPTTGRSIGELLGRIDTAGKVRLASSRTLVRV